MYGKWSSFAYITVTVYMQTIDKISSAPWIVMEVGKDTSLLPELLFNKKRVNDSRICSQKQNNGLSISSYNI